MKFMKNLLAVVSLLVLFAFAGTGTALADGGVTGGGHIDVEVPEYTTETTEEVDSDPVEETTVEETTVEETTVEETTVEETTVEETTVEETTVEENECPEETTDCYYPCYYEYYNYSGGFYYTGYWYDNCYGYIYYNANTGVRYYQKQVFSHYTYRQECYWNGYYYAYRTVSSPVYKTVWAAY